MKTRRSKEHCMEASIFKPEIGYHNIQGYQYLVLQVIPKLNFDTFP